MTRGQNTIQRLRLASQSSILPTSSTSLYLILICPGPSTRICRTCLLQIRAASSAAAPLETAPIEPSPTHRAPPPRTASQSHSITYKLKASVLLSRPPLLTRDLTPFEKSYFLYQRRLNERLALPFTRYFYYQRGTPGDIEWKRKIKERQTPARDIGVYNAYGGEGWNDELLVGDRVSEPEEQVERLLRDADVEVKERDIQGERKVVKKEEVERPMPRVTDADNSSDMKSLNRALQKTLYLVVNTGKGQWGFPSAELARQESLHTVSRFMLQQARLTLLIRVAVECGEDHRPDRRSEHEYLGRGQHTYWPPGLQLQARHFQRGERVSATRRENFLHESQDLGRASKPQGQSTRCGRFPVAG